MKPAVPEYVGDQFDEAPPGHRYGIYLKCWDQNWDVVKDKSQAVKKVSKLPKASKDQIHNVNQRLSVLIDNLPEQSHLRIYGLSIAPFVTGLGIEHPLENGFSFLQPYGLPYLPGSGIKGVLRYAACELCQTEEGGWNSEWVNKLFGSVEQSKQRGAAIFWDCVPELPSAGMSQDVMTPHYGDYYRNMGKQDNTPHDAGSPVPVTFMTVPPGSSFIFQITVVTTLLQDDKQLREGGWRGPMRKVFEHAFDWIGFGAKTSVGYGAMEIDKEKEQKEIDEQEEQKRRLDEAQEEEERRNEMSAIERQIDDVCNDGYPSDTNYRKVWKKLIANRWTECKDRLEVISWIEKEIKERDIKLKRKDASLKEDIARIKKECE